MIQVQGIHPRLAKHFQAAMGRAEEDGKAAIAAANAAYDIARQMPGQWEELIDFLCQRLDRALPADAPDALLRHRNAQRSLVQEILRLVETGANAHPQKPGGKR